MFITHKPWTNYTTFTSWESRGNTNVPSRMTIHFLKEDTFENISSANSNMLAAWESCNV